MMKMNEPSFEQSSKDDFELESIKSGSSRTGDFDPTAEGIEDVISPELQEMMNDPEYQSYLEEWPGPEQMKAVPSELKDATIYSYEGNNYYLNQKGYMYDESLSWVPSSKRIEIKSKGTIIPQESEKAA